MKRTVNGFTIIELLVSIVVIGILATISYVSFSTVQASSRNSIRASKVNLIADALEKYYSQNGEYPNCAAMSETSSQITTNTLKGLDLSALTMPKSADKSSSSILSLCNDISDQSVDPIAYLGNGSMSCSMGSSCTGWVLKYREENTNNIISINSKHGTGGVTSGISPDILVQWPGNNKTTCKDWTAPTGKTIKEFYTSHITETGYDFFYVLADGDEVYRNSGTINNQKIDISNLNATSLSVCIVADNAVQDGYGGTISSIISQDSVINPNQIVFSSQELYVPWPGNSTTTCKTWTIPGGKSINRKSK